MPRQRKSAVTKFVENTYSVKIVIQTCFIFCRFSKNDVFRFTVAAYKLCQLAENIKRYNKMTQESPTNIYSCNYTIGLVFGGTPLQEHSPFCAGCLQSQKMFSFMWLMWQPGFIMFILEIYISFQELCISNTDYKAAVPGSNPANASIPSWQHKLAA
jgi:hypothetical protein